MTQVTFFTSTNFEGIPNAVVETLGTLLTFGFELDEPAPIGGLKIYVDSDVANILNRLDISALNDNPEFLSGLTIDQDSFRNFSSSGFAVTINAGETEAFLTLPALDTSEATSGPINQENLNGIIPTTFTVKTREEVDRRTKTDPLTGRQGNDLYSVELDGVSIDNYTVAPEAASSSVLFADNEDQLPPSPVVSFSTTPTLINEAEGTALVMNFNVEGEFAPGGVTVNLEGDMAQILKQFAVVETVFDEDTGNIFYRFEEDFVDPANGFIQGGVLNPFSLEDGDPDGNGFLSNFSFTITDRNATITLPVLDDMEQEDDATITYTLARGSSYIVDPETNSGTFTLTDGVEPATSPTVGVTVAPTTLIRSEQTVMEVTFTSEGDIPNEGLVVKLEGPPQAFAEFDFSEPLEVTGGNIVETDNIASSLFFNITDPTATIELPVLPNEEEQESKVLALTLVDGEQYEIDPSASVVEVTIEDEIVLPQVRVGLLGATFSDNELITPYLVESTEDGTPILSVVLQSDNPIPEDGLIVHINTDLADISQFVNESQLNPTAFGGQVISAIYNDANFATGLRVRMDEPNTVINFDNGVGLGVSDPQTVSFFVEAGDGYLNSQEAATVTVYQSLDQIPAPPEVLPEIGVRIAGRQIGEQFPPLPEGEGTITLDFTVEGDIPPEGVIAYLTTDQLAGLSEFDVLSAEGGLFPTPNSEGEGFYFKITQSMASVTLQGAMDDREEGVETINFSLEAIPGYTITDNAAGVSVQLGDDENSKIQVSLEGQPQDLVEESETVATLTFNLSSPPPQSIAAPSRDGLPLEPGILVTVQTDDLGQFNPDSFSVTGGELVNVGEETIDIRITQQTATLSMAITNDEVVEGEETAIFTLVEPQENADYQISTTNPQQNQVTFAVYDTLNESPIRVESAESDDTIATSIPIAINSDRSTTIVTGAIDFDFDNNRDVDQTEDVDMYSVELQAGDRLTVDLDFIASDDSEDPVPGHLRLFNAAGDDLVENTPGTDLEEGFVSGGNTFIDFTADTAGTYYIGVSQTFNGNYDPNLKGTGDGALLDLGLGIGEYELKIDLNIEPSDGDMGPVAIELPEEEGGDPNDTATTNNDIIANAVPLNLSPDNVSVTIDAEIAERFQERDNAVDATEDVDMYSFALEEDQSIFIDIDANGIGDAGLGSILDSVLRIFDSQGNELASNVSGAAPGEVFQAQGDPYLVFTAPEAGTYYAAVSALGNDFYDPNVANTGSGWTIGEEVGADIYKINFSTVEDVPSPVPVVSIEVTPPTVLEGGPDDTATIEFTVDGEVPEVQLDGEGNYVSGGLSVFLDVQELDVLEVQFDDFVPNELIVGPFSDETQPQVLEFILFEEAASVSFTAIDDDIPEEPIGFDFTLLEDQDGSDYTVDPDANMGSFTLVDDDLTVPTVGITVDNTELIEGREVTFDLDALGGVNVLPSADNPVTVIVNGDTVGGLAEFELFDSENNPLFTTVGIDSVSILDDDTDFSAILIDPNASITFSVVDDGPNEGQEQFTYTLADDQTGYVVDPNANSVTISIEDANVITGTSGADIFDAGLTPEFDGVDDTVFARGGDDLIDTTGGNGGNRLFGEEDNDTFILLSNDTAFGGNGDDRFFLQQGNNEVNGGLGADQFWIAVAEIPEDPNTITDFDSVEGDVLGIAGLGIGFDDLTLTDEGGNTLIASGNNQLAILLGVESSSLSAANFVFE